MAFQKLSGFDIKAICAFSPTSAKKQNGILTMDIKTSKLSSVKIEIAKHCSKTKTPLIYALNVSQYNPQEKKTHHISCILDSTDPSKREYEIKVGVSDFERTTEDFKQEMLLQFSIIMKTFGIFSTLANGADQINFNRAFKELLEDGEGPKIFGSMYEDFLKCWTVVGNRFKNL